MEQRKWLGSAKLETLRSPHSVICVLFSVLLDGDPEIKKISLIFPRTIVTKGYMHVNFAQLSI